MNEKQIARGERMAKARKDAGLTQAEVADKLDVSFQAVSLWERGESAPETDNLIKLAKLLKVSVSSLVEDRGDCVFSTTKKIFEWTHMVSFIRHTARAHGLKNTLKALDIAIKAHEGQTRKQSDIPYIYHPLNMACHCFALNIIDDDIIAACLLHDAVEDCDYTNDDLEVNEETKKLVRLMSHEKNDDDRERVMKAYYRNLSSYPKAALIKCIDRCNNLTTMSWGLSRERIYRYIQDTETYIKPLFEVIKKEPDYNNAAWLLKYQIESMLDIYKRLM